jgi:hypothetical protein
MTWPLRLTGIVLLASHAHVSAQQDPRFLSWYNGWGSHRVWGLGVVAGVSQNAFVKCGDKKIKVVAIYDTHTAFGVPPTQAQSRAFAASHNSALSRQLASQGLKCAFEEEPKAE